MKYYEGKNSVQTMTKQECAIYLKLIHSKSLCLIYEFSLVDQDLNNTFLVLTSTPWNTSLKIEQLQDFPGVSG